MVCNAGYRVTVLDSTNKKSLYNFIDQLASACGFPRGPMRQKVSYVLFHTIIFPVQNFIHFDVISNKHTRTNICIYNISSIIDKYTLFPFLNRNLE